jgi:glyoxylase-like metal-dependent hydrolase (beta-lactamase superfamily II)
MILESTVHPEWRSNGYLMAAGPGSPALVVDPGPPVDELLRVAAEQDLQISHVVITHRHDDHHEHAARIREAFPDTVIIAHAIERPHIHLTDTDARTDARIEIGGLTLGILETPGHTAGSICARADGHLFTGDTLFKGSIGGLISPGHTTFEDLRSSIMDVLMALPADTVVLPGHSDPTTIGEERERNPFIRVWRGLDAEGDARCEADGDPARMIVWARDYDDGHKAWIRRADGTNLVVAGSRVAFAQGN